MSKPQALVECRNCAHGYVTEEDEEDDRKCPSCRGKGVHKPFKFKPPPREDCPLPCCDKCGALMEGGGLSDPRDPMRRLCRDCHDDRRPT